MRSNKWLTLGLVVSVLVNVALIGFLAGRATHSPPLRMIDPAAGFMRVLPGLPEHRRDQLRPLVRKHMRSVLPSLREMRRAQQATRSAILAEPLDIARLTSALADVRVHLADSQVSSHQAFVRLVEALTPAERRLLVEAMSRRFQRGPQFRREGRDPDGKMPDSSKSESQGVDCQGAHQLRRPIPGRIPASYRGL